METKKPKKKKLRTGGIIYQEIMRVDNYKVKEVEMNHTHKALLKKLHEKYPGKHISISLTSNYYEHSDKYAIDYCVYVTDVCCKNLPTFSDVKLYVEFLCKTGGTE